ncbi:MAG: tryptophan-rich sensory protein [Candidatus Aegiribacteria sp.]|nr:tryptophan-rich sensory protein [Candidatus Aegiribacteria sp.]MBD3295105.1 tryptophan-rich sensory protein [Candidatus Fermentibacteria bacterium]
MKTYLILAGCIVVSLLAGFIGSMFPPGEWYQTLAKPSFNPPGYVFGPVWTVLYILMGVAAWLVIRKVGFANGRVPLMFFGFQLVLNALWSYLFFGRRLIGVAFFEIIVLWVLILVTLILFWRVRRLAGVLMLPYILWVSFASVLNFSLWRLNG